MPIEVELPGGQVVEFPDGTDNATMEKALRQYAQSPAKPSANNSDFARLITGKPREQAVNARSLIPRAIKAQGEIQQAATHSVMGALHGGSELVERGIRAGANAVLPEGGVRDYINRTVDSDIAAGKRNEAAYRAQRPDTLASSIGNVAGDAVVAAAPMGRIKAGLPLLQRLGASGLAGAVVGGAQPIVEGESRGENAAYGGALGVLGQAGGDIVMASGKRAATAIAPHVRALYEAAKARGITLTPAQLSDSKFLRFMQSQLGILPGSGAAAHAAAQKAQFNRQVAGAIGEEADAVTPEVYARAKARQSKQFDELTSRNELRVDMPLLQRLEQISQEAKIAGGEVASTVQNVVDDFMGRATSGKQGVTVPGKAFQAFDSQLGKLAMSGTPTAHFVGLVKSTIRDAMDDSISAADKSAWSALRREYGNRKTIRDLVSDTGISPTGLMARVRANGAGKEAMASGTRGDLGELARIGQLMKEPPSSGTAERTLINSLWNPLQWPGLALGAAVGPTAGRTANSGALSQLLMREGRGQARQALAPVVRVAPLAALPAASQAAEPKRKPKK